MSNEFQITYKDEFVEVVSSGDKNIEVATELWTAVAAGNWLLNNGSAAS